MHKLYIWIIALTAAVAVILLADSLAAGYKIRNTEFLIDCPEEAVADGRSSVTVGLQVVMDGKPRAGDFVQSWVQAGDAKLLPLYTFLDEEGRCEYTLTPHVLSPYSRNPLVVTVYDMSFGKIIERGKTETYSIKLNKPEDS